MRIKQRGQVVTKGCSCLECKSKRQKEKEFGEIKWELQEVALEKISGMKQGKWREHE